jgi:hypothetical protein
MSTSSAVIAGTNATASQYNNLRTDAIVRERVYVFEVKGSIVTGDEQGPKYIVPSAATVTSILHKIASGTSATFRIQEGTGDVDAGIVAGTSVLSETSITDAALAANSVLSLDVTAVSGSPVDLLVEVRTTENI